MCTDKIINNDLIQILNVCNLIVLIVKWIIDSCIFKQIIAIDNLIVCFDHVTNCASLIIL